MDGISRERWLKVATKSVLDSPGVCPARTIVALTLPPQNGGVYRTLYNLSLKLKREHLTMNMKRKKAGHL